MVNPDALNLPPFIEITGRNSIVVNFYSSTDQSLTQPPDLLVSRAVGELPRSVFTPDQQETEFEKNYMEAVGLIREAQAQLNTDDRIETYFIALKTLKQAALSAEFDIQIAQALKQRDLLLRTMPKLIIRNVQMSILALNLESTDTKADPEFSKKLLKQLIHAERYATTREQQQKITTLRRILR
jgi:predicted phosphoadenosine phosphosulfate sulfurtransferase